MTMLSPCILQFLIQFITLLQILEECVIVYRRLWIHYNDMVSLLPGIVWGSPLLKGCCFCSTPWPNYPESIDWSVVEMTECGDRAPTGSLQNIHNWNPPVFLRSGSTTCRMCFEGLGVMSAELMMLLASGLW